MNTNVVSLSGNLTADPEVRQTKNGKTVAQYRIAVNDRVKGQDGNWTDYANFINCVQFGVSPKFINCLSKGTKIAVVGKLHFSEWVAKDGSNRNRLEVWVNDVDFMDSPKQQASQVRQQPIQQYNQFAAQPNLSDDEIPF